MAKLKTGQPPKKKEMIAFKVSPGDRAAIQAMADAFADGNVSQWVRFAALNFKPKKEHLEEGEGDGTN
jgi:hypothetical protein